MAEEWYLFPSRGPEDFMPLSSQGPLHVTESLGFPVYSTTSYINNEEAASCLRLQERAEPGVT